MSEKHTFRYKGYEGSIETSIEDMCLTGQVLYVRDCILYHAATLPELKAQFQEAVDQYLADCEDLNRPPNKPFSGSFNVRIGRERHKELAAVAFRKSKSINSLVGDAVDLYLEHHDKGIWPQVTFTFSATHDAAPVRETSKHWEPQSAPKLSLVK